MNFQRLLLGIQGFWAERGCVLQQPYDIEVGAGTMHPDTFLRVLGPEPWKVAYCQPSRRPERHRPTSIDPLRHRGPIHPRFRTPSDEREIQIRQRDVRLPRRGAVEEHPRQIDLL